ncbi:ribulose-phosphate 3-epimerase [[Mycoplasma] mobile]|uniref:Ribulose-5-phosphate 3-epimerase n=1 Tax=Mycoplasma mobile (strain ATCC 43663 / 163K / NCTC 11711) TaxID=267748 RepID=Q6KH83_MYCM1|nr:ribulose-phosphate 3-epimerase [[Mycoplasma] mobile]AAT28047.1 ribulose-5-phosphate 3-epimerase [Mycoplasma mobile 163K]
MKLISPSLLNVEESKRAEIATKMIELGIKWIHYDFMDGKFVPETAISFENYMEIKEKSPSHIKDIHLMVQDVSFYVEKFLNKAEYITFHFEALNYNEIKKILKKYHGLQKFGIALKPKTNIEQIYEYLPYVDLVLIMSVEPGYGGQKFIPNSLEKITKLKKYLLERSLDIVIQVDGGINEESGPQAFESGADILVSGSYLVKNLTKEQIDSLFPKEKN